ncbi:hypothetical protein H483_0112190 [Dietzia sp. UCD-THP]|nr:hypothetical protein H483_0112190 [Dietzia sp. UCD-THP]
MYPGQGGGQDDTWYAAGRAQDVSNGYPPMSEDWAAYDHETGGPGPGTVAVLVVVAVVLLALVGLLAFFFLGRSGEEPGSAPPDAVTVWSTASPTTTEASPRQSPTTRAAAPTAVLEECSDAGDVVLPRSGLGTTVTSCPFAREVREAYLGAGHHGGAAVIDASSPVTGLTYTMVCAGERDAVVCRGGGNAVVYLY